MASEVHQKATIALDDFDFGVSWAELNSLDDGYIAWCKPETVFDDEERCEVIAQITVGSPTKGQTIEFYAGRGFNSLNAGIDDPTLTDHGTIGADSGDRDALLGALGAPVAVIVVDDEATQAYIRHFNIWYPGDNFQLFVYNNTGDAFHSSGQDIAFRGWLPEGQ